MLEQITDEFKPMMLPKNLTCTVAAEADITIRCDVKKMERVFDNLLRNSINYSFENSEIQVSTSRCEQGVVMIFLNHGNTIPEHKLNHIFEQFYRLDTARASQTGGAGLGLAIAKEIVELHQGTITASSENDVIRFTIRLPQEDVGKS
jgi:two-component system sensor histidine kinase VanS